MPPIVSAPHEDCDLPRFLAEVGLPGLVDLHTHFMPEPVLRKVWLYFDALQEPGDEGWPIRYRGDEATRLATLRRLGVVRFTSLCYAHKPGMARWLNTWCATFAEENPDCARSGTFFAEEGVDSYVADALEQGAEVFKIHLQVGGFDPRATVLDSVWARLARAGVPVVIHAGSGPHRGGFTGPGPLSDLLRKHPALTLVIAHGGAPEYDRFLDLALAYPNVMIDTTMVFTDFFNDLLPPPPQYAERFLEHPERVVYGSDFPQIPYPYAHQLEALIRIGADADWLRVVCWENGRRLLGMNVTSGAERLAES